jgi:PAS domain S-box-containing protein
MSTSKPKRHASEPRKPSNNPVDTVPFETLTAFMSEGLLVFDAKGCITFANAAARDLFGLTPDQQGTPIEELALARQVRYPDGTPVQPEALPILRALQGEVIQHFEHLRLNPLTGQEYFADASVAPFRSEDGEIVGALLLLSDITARKQAERETAASKQTLQALIQASPLAIIARDADGLLTTWNPAAERIFGWMSEEVLGKSLLTVPQDRQGEYQHLLQKFRRGTSVTGYESQRQRRDGTLVDVSIWGAPRYNVDGSVGGVMALIDDITDRKLLQRKIEEMATTDALTKLANRHYLLERLRRDMAVARRQSQELSLLMIDVDRFKTINDRFGHAVGDRVLRHLAAMFMVARNLWWSCPVQVVRMRSEWLNGFERHCTPIHRESRNADPCP